MPFDCIVKSHKPSSLGIVIGSQASVFVNQSCVSSGVAPLALGPHYTRHVEQENIITSVVLNGLCGPLFFIGGKNVKNPPSRTIISFNESV